MDTCRKAIITHLLRDGLVECVRLSDVAEEVLERKGNELVQGATCSRTKLRYGRSTVWRIRSNDGVSVTER